MHLRVLGNKILLFEQKIQKRPSGILIPENVREDFGPKVFVVSQVGPKVKEVQKGDRILCFSHDAGPIDLDGVFKIVTEDQVMMVIPASESQSPQRDAQS